MILSLLVAASVFWLYAATLRGLVIEWLSSADASYGIVLAAVALVVLWRRRESFLVASQPTGSSLPGGAVLLGGLAVDPGPHPDALRVDRPGVEHLGPEGRIPVDALGPDVGPLVGVPQVEYAGD